MNKKLLQKNENLKLKYDTLLLERKINLLNKYDSVAPSADRKRRKTEIETQNEEQILRPTDRFKAINLARDLERNFTNGKNLIRQLKVNVVGAKGGKVRLKTDTDFDKQAADWFNSDWAKNCDSRDDNHFNDFLKLIVASVAREGDCLAVFDDINEDDGKLIFYEADQLVSVDASDWEKQTEWVEKVKVGKETKTIPLKQESGVVYNSFGRVVAYIVTAKRGLQTAKITDVTILAAGSAKLLKSTWRFNQLRGTGDMITASADLQDIYEMRAKELQSAKVAASFAAAVQKKDAVMDAVLRGGNNPEDLLSSGSSGSSSAAKNYEALEALTGGYMEYLEPGEEIKILDHNRPNINGKEFFDFVNGSAGSAFGLSKTYSSLQVESSYTAFRGDMLLSWATFYDLQKWLERKFCDWVAKKAINWAIRKGILKNAPDGWERSISWIWPVMPQVDPVKDSNAKNNNIKNAYTTLEDELGPDWKEKIDSAAEQLNYAKEKGIPLSAYETVAGATVQENKTEKE